MDHTTSQDLKEQISAMSAEDIREAIRLLQDCKAPLHNTEWKERAELSVLLPVLEKSPARPAYSIDRQPAGYLHILGFSLLPSKLFEEYREILRGSGGNWWLAGHRLAFNEYVFPDMAIDPSTIVGSIRPVLILDRTHRTGMTPGDLFSIGSERFIFLSNTCAIHEQLLPEPMINPKKWKESPVRTRLTAWYEQSIKPYSEG